MSDKKQRAVRERLPDTRTGKTHKFSLSGSEGYLTANTYEDGRLAEIFITASKEGSTLAGLMDTIGILTSMALQYGVPLSAMAKKFRGTKFEPSEHDKATSVVDYIFRWLEDEYGEVAK